MKKKTLVLCIDRDDDIGKKAKLKGPFVGEEKCLKAAEALGIADPTESDVNAIFMAVKQCREMKKDGEDAEVVLIAGHPSRSYLADKKIIGQLEKIVENGGFTDISFVSDGADDEQLIPILQSRAKVSNVSTVIVKQSKELEKSYYVLKEAIKDPHFARVIFGLPGVVLAIYGIVNLLGVRDLSINVILGLVGLYLVFKGFGVEDAIVGAFNTFRKTTSIERASFPLYLGSFFLALLSIWAGFDNMGIVSRGVAADAGLASSQWFIIGVSSFSSGFIGLFSIAAIFFLAGRIGDMYYKKEYYRIRKYARMAVSAIALYVIIENVSDFALYWSGGAPMGPSFADLMVSVGIAFMITVIGFVVITHIYVNRYVSKRIKTGLEIKDIEGRPLGSVVGVDYKNQAFKYAHEGEKAICSFGKVLIVKDYVVVSS